MPKRHIYRLKFEQDDFYPFLGRGFIEPAIKRGLEDVLGVELTESSSVAELTPNFNAQGKTTYLFDKGRITLDVDGNNVKIKLNLPQRLSEYPGSLCFPQGLRRIAHQKAPPEKRVLETFSNSLVVRTTHYAEDNEPMRLVG